MTQMDKLITVMRSIITDRELPEQIDPDAQFVTDLGFDSYDMVELAFRIETSFSITVTDDVFKNNITVRDVHDYIVSQLV